MFSVRNALSASVTPVSLCVRRFSADTAPATFIDRLRKIAQAQAPEHPFKRSVTHQNASSVMAKYLAMSQSFPYIQAGAYANLIQRCMKQNRSVSPDVEKTFVAGSFLCWDETGGHHLVSGEGNGALPKTLDTRTYFHSNLLSQDLNKIFGREIAPDYCADTRNYMTVLLKKLGSPNKVERVATMVAFEMHAEKMIQALWESISELTKIPKEELIYFHIHVGGDDPAEAYHVALTQRLVKELVPQKQENRFAERFKVLYQLNIDWCQAISKRSK